MQTKGLLVTEIKPICSNCRYWDRDGIKGSLGYRSDEKGSQLFTRYCRFMPEGKHKWFDDWCGQFKKMINLIH